MSFDFKKKYKEFYIPENTPYIVNVPPAQYIAVRGSGNPNEEDGEYKKAIGMLYAVAYTIKMSKNSDHRIAGYYDFVVPPLEGFWWQTGIDGVDYSCKETFNWISIIRMPDYLTQEDFTWVVSKAERKKKLNLSKVELLHIKEGLCVQIMHTGPFDTEPASVAIMNDYLEKNGYITDITDKRLHHEIYLSDSRKVTPEKWKTVIRHPIKKL